MAYQKRGRIEAHDAVGVESDLIDFEREYGDGYGNNVAHGDLSMQRMVEEGVRNTRASCHGDDVTATAYDKEPLMSKVQHRYLRAAEARGDVPAGTTSKMARHTPGGIKGLPERKG